MAIVYPTASSLFPSAQWWQDHANSVTVELAAVKDAGFPQRDLAAGEDLNVLTKPGLYRLPGVTGILNLPPFETPQTGFSGFVTVANQPGGTWAAQEVIRYGVAPERWWRVSTNTTGAWGDWMRVPTIDDVAVEAANARLVEDWSRRRGGVKPTGGKGAVALRFDHGLANLKTVILPLLRARALPFGVAINPSNWAQQENTGCTQADVQGWVTNDRAEVWNHGGNHQDATTPGTLRTQLVTSLATLRSQIPNAQIDGFMLPGVGGTQYLGFDAASPGVFTSTLAGRLLLKSHAVISGSMGSARRVIDGVVRQGQAHYTMDAQTASSIKNQIDLAISERTGLQLMLHPSNLNGSGMLTTAALTDVLDYIKTKRDAGDLVVFGPYDLLLASAVVGAGAAGPKGDKGDTGAPGGSDAATATYINTGTETQAAGDARWVVKANAPANANDYGVKGDGTTDDASALNSLLAAAVAAKVPAFIPPRRYALASQLTIPTGAVVQAAGATFVKTTNSSTYAITVGSDVTIDALNVEVTGGATNEAGVQITGSRVQVGSIRVVSLTNDQPGANALLIGNPGGAACSNIRVDSVTLTQFRTPLRVAQVDRLTLSNLRVTNYLYGAYIIDVTNSVFRGARLTGTSPASTGGAGNNAMLLESQGADFACSGIVFEDWIAEDAPEHAFRIGGSLAVRDITFRRCIARKPGSAPGNVATGGSGFKALGVAGHHHQRIVYTDCTVLDGNTNASGINNHAAFSIGHCDCVTLTGPTVTAEANTYAGKLGIYVYSSTGVYITSPSVSKVTNQAVYITKDGSDPAPQGVSDVQITGGRLHTTATGTQPLVIDCGDQAFSNIVIDTVCDAGGNAYRQATPTGTGAYSNIHVKVKYVNAPTASTSPPILGTTAHLIDYTGPIYGSFGITCADGSKYVDTTLGVVRFRKGGAWSATL